MFTKDKCMVLGSFDSSEAAWLKEPQSLNGTDGLSG